MTNTAGIFRNLFAVPVTRDRLIGRPHFVHPGLEDLCAWLARLVALFGPLLAERRQSIGPGEALFYPKGRQVGPEEIAEVAGLIEDQNSKGLSGLPGIGPATADRVIAKLHRKIAKFALIPPKEMDDAIAQSASESKEG